MSWHGIEGHDDVVDRFRRAVSRGRLASTFLFLGPPGVGKRMFALRLAQALLCETNPEAVLDPCGNCPACLQVQAGTHPDLEQIARLKNESVIKVEQLIGDREHRMREGLCYRFSLKPTRGGRKIAVIDDADHLNVEGANCLLKTLEEPPPRSVLVLIGTNEQRQLPTIRSRAQVVRFSPLATELVERLLVEKRLVEDPREARLLAQLSGGSLQQAVMMADPALREFREALFQQLIDLETNQFSMAASVTAFVNEAGKEGPAKRQRMNQILDFAAEYYRGLMRRLEGIAVEADAALQRSLDAGQKRFRQDSQAAAACLERCLDAQQEVDRNANQNSLAECWADDLAMISLRGYAVTSEF